jgi:hemolysin III
MRKIQKVKKVKYTLGEEIVNAITHGIGAIFGVVALVLTIIFSVKNSNTMGLVSSIVYGVSMIFMFTTSCVYHALSPNIKGKKVLRVIDHCDIYVFIAGCYTPFCLSTIGGTTGWIIFGINWTCAIIGVLLNSINLEKFKIPSFAMYLIMGWMIVFSFKPLSENLAPMGINLLLLGGIVYTVGAVLYLIGSKRKYFHSVFHIFVLLGAISQFFSILLYSI